MSSGALVSIPVGVLIERHAASSPWLDFVCRPVSVLTGVPAASPWTRIRSDGPVTTFYAGSAAIDLHRTETANYRDNLATGAPVLWVVLRPTSVEPGFELLVVTADPAEGEALTLAGNDLVETVPMPDAIKEIVRDFIAVHHVERTFFKRKRENFAAASAAAGRNGSGENSREDPE